MNDLVREYVFEDWLLVEHVNEELPIRTILCFDLSDGEIDKISPCLMIKSKGKRGFEVTDMNGGGDDVRILEVRRKFRFLQGFGAWNYFTEPKLVEEGIPREIPRGTVEGVKRMRMY